MLITINTIVTHETTAPTPNKNVLKGENAPLSAKQVNIADANINIVTSHKTKILFNNLTPCYP